MRIEYDPAKRLKTIADRGLDMEDVPAVFEGPTRTLPDLRVDYGEPRYITVGYLGTRMVVIVWTPRGDVRRVISFRKANRNERKTYRPGLGGPVL